MSFTVKDLNNNCLKVEKVAPEVTFDYVGGKIKSTTLHKMIKNGYEDKPKHTDSVDGYVLDKSLSGSRAQVYYHPETKHLVVNHRGTKGSKDVMTDIGLMFGHKSGKRFVQVKRSPMRL